MTNEDEDKNLIEAFVAAVREVMEHNSERLDGHHISMAALEESIDRLSRWHISDQDRIMALEARLDILASTHEPETTLPASGERADLVSREAVRKCLGIHRGEPAHVVDGYLLSIPAVAPTTHGLPADLVRRVMEWTHTGDGNAYTIMLDLQRHLREQPAEVVHLEEMLRAFPRGTSLEAAGKRLAAAGLCAPRLMAVRQDGGHVVDSGHCPTLPRAIAAVLAVVEDSSVAYREPLPLAYTACGSKLVVNRDEDSE